MPWVCGHCGSTSCQHPYQDRVNTDGLTRPRPGDEWMVPKPFHPLCKCGHDRITHAGGGCIACRKCPKFLCKTCKEDPCNCKQEWTGASSVKAVKRYRGKITKILRIDDAQWAKALAKHAEQEALEKLEEEMEDAEN